MSWSCRRDTSVIIVPPIEGAGYTRSGKFGGRSRKCNIAVEDLGTQGDIAIAIRSNTFYICTYSNVAILCSTGYLWRFSPCLQQPYRYNIFEWQARPVPGVTNPHRCCCYCDHRMVSSINEDVDNLDERLSRQAEAYCLTVIHTVS